MAQSAVMKRLREKMKIIFIVVIVVFVGSIVFERGLGGFRGRQQDWQGYLAVVDEEPVDPIDYSRAVENAIIRAREENPAITEGIISQMREQVWQEMINNILYRNQLEKKHISVTSYELNEELRINPPDYIRNHEFFHTDGRYDYNKFIEYITSPSIDILEVQRLEENVRAQIANSKLQQHVNNMTFVTRHAALEEIIKDASTVDAEYIRVVSGDFKDMVSEPSEEQLHKYYEANIDKYETDRGFILGHTVIALEVTAKDSANLEALADSVYRLALEDDDFNYLAVQFSQDPTAIRNEGLIGWIMKGQLVPEFEEVVFELDSGQVSEPFHSPYGLHVAKVNDKNDTLEAINVSHILFRMEPSYETLDSVTILSEEVRALAMTEGLEAATKNLGLEYNRSGILTKNDPIPDLGYYSLINNFALNDSAGIVYDVIASPFGYHIFELHKTFDAGIADFDDIRDIVYEDYMLDQSKALARREAQNLRNSIVSAGGFRAAGFEPDSIVGSPHAFHPEHGYDPILAGSLMGLAEGKFSQVIEGAYSSYYIVRVNERHIPDSDEIQYMIEPYHRQLLEQNRQVAFEKWFTNLRDNTEIEDRRHLMWRR